MYTVKQTYVLKGDVNYTGVATCTQKHMCVHVILKKK